MRLNSSYFVYITSNPGRTVLYTGVTNDLERRMYQHYEARGQQTSFVGRYYCYELIYWEAHERIERAIAREKETKGWTRAKKEALIDTLNPKRLTLRPWLPEELVKLSS